MSGVFPLKSLVLTTSYSPASRMNFARWTLPLLTASSRADPPADRPWLWNRLRTSKFDILSFRTSYDPSFLLSPFKSKATQLRSVEIAGSPRAPEPVKPEVDGRRVLGHRTPTKRISCKEDKWVFAPPGLERKLSLQLGFQYGLLLYSTKFSGENFASFENNSMSFKIWTYWLKIWTYWLTYWQLLLTVRLLGL